MKFQLSSREFLALYNILFALSHNEPVAEGTDDDMIMSILGRMRATLLASLDAPHTAKDSKDSLMDAWIENQEEKIRDLASANDKIMQELVDSRYPTHDGSLEDELAESVKRQYPRRPPAPVMPRPGKYKANRR